MQRKTDVSFNMSITESALMQDIINTIGHNEKDGGMYISTFCQNALRA